MSECRAPWHAVALDAVFLDPDHRRHAAEALLALGMPQEAQAMASTALQEDPQASADMRLLMVQAAAIFSSKSLPLKSLPEPLPVSKYSSSLMLFGVVEPSVCSSTLLEFQDMVPLLLITNPSFTEMLKR